MRTKKACGASPTEARRRHSAILAFALASLMTVSMCGATARTAVPMPGNPDSTASVHVLATFDSTGTVPQITIVSPKANERTGHGVEISYRIANFTLAEPHGQPNAPNEGHVQLLVNDRVVMEVSQYEPVLVVSLPEGDITITARLVNNDGSRLNPDAFHTVPIYVVASSAVTLPLVSNGGIALLLAFMLVVLILRRRKAAARNAKAGEGKSP